MAVAALPLLVGTAGTAATAGAAATAATAGLFGAGGAMTLGGILGGAGSLFSVMSAFSQLKAGNMAASASKNEAAQYQMQAEVEKTRAIQEESNRKARLNEILNNQMAMTAGRGVMVGSGSDIAISDFSMEEAKREGGIASLDSQFRQQQLRMQAGQARLSGKASLLSSRGKAAGTIFDAATTAFDRIST